MSESIALASTRYLFKEGLALANQLDAPSPIHSISSPSHVPLDPLSAPHLKSENVSEPLEDSTLLQSHSLGQTASPTAAFESKKTTVQTNADQSWTQVWLQRAFIKLQQKSFLGALDNFKRVLQRDAQAIEALNGIAVAHYHLGQFQDAAASLSEAIVLRPTQSTLYCNLGAVLYGSQDFAGAVAAFQKAARLDPKDVIAYYGMGLSLLQQQELHKAIAAFQRAITINDQHANSYYGLGYVHYQLGDLPAAIAAVGKAKQRNPLYAKRYEAFLKHCLAQDDKPRKAKSSKR